MSSTFPWNKPELKTLISEAVSKGIDELKLAEKISKGPYTSLRNEILDYIQLVPKFRKKFQFEGLLSCDKLALEQSTARDIGLWKAKLFNNVKSVDDLCCGMGGDSFYIPKDVNVQGFDISEERLAMYEYNTNEFGSSRKAVLADVRTLKQHSDYFMIDPARRQKEGDNQRNFTELTPSLLEVIEIARHYRGGMAKLSPGYPEEEIPNDAELVYLGNRSDCRECLILFGELAKHPGKVRAVFVDKNGNGIEWISQSNRADFEELDTGGLLEYIAEPIPVLVRSHLFTEIALRENAHLISTGIAYITSSTPLDPKAFTNFRVIDSVPMATSAIRKMLKKYDIGKLTLKKRGVEICPESEIKRLAPNGKREGILFYTRLRGEKTAILADIM
ncbi:MAG: hypothetical protein M0P13_04880 [Fibrobacteraceae bacterium]|nr:hypothetical protein [Fibrobacteraceae bacterium]